jgi:anti-sigma B factor antagonist
MKCKTEFVGDVLVVVARGPWTGGSHHPPFLHDEVKDQIAQGTRKVLIDFEKSSTANSAGVGILVAIRTSILAANGQLKLCHVTRRIRTSLVVAGILPLFDVYKTREEAMLAFEPAPV